jgi:AraC-like DNA-binding protein
LEVKVYTPHAALQDCVLNISTVNAVLPETQKDAITPYPPTPFQSLMFYCNNGVSMSRTESDFEQQPLTVLVGPQFSRVNVKVHGYLSAIRVDFLPGGLYRLLSMSMNELFDGGFDALNFFGTQMNYINEQLRNTSDLEEGKDIVEQFLLNQAKRLKDIQPIDYAMRMLLKSNGSMTIEDLASHACLSLKQFERKCNERIGMNPKAYARVLRFSHAYRMHEAQPKLTWIEIAHTAGYYDQMHMIRDFKVFAGVNPSIIEQQLLSTPLRMQRDLPL